MNSAPEQDELRRVTKLHKIRITVSPKEWAVLQTSAPRGDTATGGSDYRSPDGRLIHSGSGFGGYCGAPLQGQLEFHEVVDVHGTKGTWDGERTFNLHAGVLDTSKMRDAIAFSIFRAAGVPAPRTVAGPSGMELARVADYERQRAWPACAETAAAKARAEDSECLPAPAPKATGESAGRSARRHQAAAAFAEWAGARSSNR